MTPHKQLLIHDPTLGLYGDCHRTAIACVLDVEPWEVPHFYDGRNMDRCERAVAEEEAFFRSVGLIPITTAWNGELQAVLDSMGSLNPSAYYLLSGTSKRGCGHTVVAQGGNVLHDPSPRVPEGEHSLVGPMPDGLYWITFFGKLL